MPTLHTVIVGHPADLLGCADVRVAVAGAAIFRGQVTLETRL